MKITKRQLKRIIKEELGRVLNENELYDYFKPFDARKHPGVAADVERGKRKVYDQNNGNILLIDDEGVPYVSYADERSKYADIGDLLDTLEKDGYRKAGLAVPMSPAGFESATMGGDIDAEEIRDYEMPNMRHSNYYDNIDRDLPLLQKAVGKRDISAPGEANWNERKDQIVYLGSGGVPDSRGRPETRGRQWIYFKTSKSGKYYKIPVS